MLYCHTVLVVPPALNPFAGRANCALTQFLTNLNELPTVSLVILNPLNAGTTARASKATTGCAFKRSDRTSLDEDDCNEGGQISAIHTAPTSTASPA